MVGLLNKADQRFATLSNLDMQQCPKMFCNFVQKRLAKNIRKVIYTTNAIESLNSTYRKLNRQRIVFPSDTALLKALYLATFEATKRWTMSIRNWGQVYGELSIMYDGRLPE